MGKTVQGWVDSGSPVVARLAADRSSLGARDGAAPDSHPGRPQILRSSPHLCRLHPDEPGALVAGGPMCTGRGRLGGMHGIRQAGVRGSSQGESNRQTFRITDDTKLGRAVAAKERWPAQAPAREGAAVCQH
jgi:hypothetical protein